uniref:Uncharacterized protein n=1 Tax=Molossus molossus TaxID=27622 RepID=A0A7J8HIC8_MOLMO|nr:hypothetical protein HJG59_011021 [Molossus molossus]
MYVIITSLIALILNTTHLIRSFFIFHPLTEKYSLFFEDNRCSGCYAHSVIDSLADIYGAGDSLLLHLLSSVLPLPPLSPEVCVPAPHCDTEQVWDTQEYLLSLAGERCLKAFCSPNSQALLPLGWHTLVKVRLTTNIKLLPDVSHFSSIYM